MSADSSDDMNAAAAPSISSSILLIPYQWIGDFVRCHSVVKLLRARWPERPVDMLSNANNAPLIDYMPGLRRPIVCDLPRRRLAPRQVWALTRRLRAEHYGTALVMLRTWKSALAPFLAGIPERVGFVGEARFLLLNDLRWGERRLERMIDRCGALALPKGTPFPAEWPLPELRVPAAELVQWLAHHGLAAEVPPRREPVVALCPGAIGPGKRWSTTRATELARLLAEAGIAVWVVGGPGEAKAARQIAGAGARVRDLTGPDLRNAILALAAADAAVSNDSGLMHVAAALGTPTVALFGPTSPRLWAPLNPLAAVLEPGGAGADIRGRKVDDISPQRVFAAVQQVLAKR